jgi:hypothetical protein
MQKFEVNLNSTQVNERVPEKDIYKNQKNKKEVLKKDAEIRSKLGWFAGNLAYKKIIRTFRLREAQKMEKCQKHAYLVYDDSGHEFIWTNSCNNRKFCCHCGERYAFEKAAEVKNTFTELEIIWNGIRYKSRRGKKAGKFELRFCDVEFTVPEELREMDVKDLDEVAQRTLIKFYSKLLGVKGVVLGGCATRHIWSSNFPWKKLPHVRYFYVNIIWNGNSWQEIPYFLTEEQLQELKKIYAQELGSKCSRGNDSSFK